MIFATIGTQLPFDRLIAALDSWAAHNLDVPITAQVGSTSRQFQHLNTVASMPQNEFRRHFQAASLVIGHAGMGTILSAAELGKPLIVMPRLAKFGEHRNDHQQDTAREMARLSHVTVVENDEELHTALDIALAQSFTMLPASAIEAEASAALLAALRDFVWTTDSGAANEAPQADRSVA